MATEIYMPKNGMDMTEGTLIRWLKNEGDHVELGEPIMEIETDKVTMESEAPASGILLKILCQEGAVVPVLTTMGYIGEAGEKIDASAPAAPKDTAEPEATVAAPCDYDYNVAVIGGGPAGYVAAITAAQLGAPKVVLFEKDTVGGTCLNRGCIPTKTYLKTAEYLHHIRNSETRGVVVEGPVRVDMPGIVDNKSKVVSTLTGGVAKLLRSNAVEVVEGEACLGSEHSVLCGGKEYTADKIILCGGSKPVRMSIPGADNENVLTSTELLDLRELPARLCIVGGGSIGCELGSAFCSFGSEVTIVEQMDRLVYSMDREVSDEVGKALSANGIKLMLGEKILEFKSEGGQMSVVTENGHFECDKVLLAVGRKPDLACLGAMKDKITVENGRVLVDDKMKTNIDNIYACGDVNGRSMLAYSAFKMGEVAAENCVKSGERKCDLSLVPNLLYSIPEAASIGMSEDEARRMYPDTLLVGRFPMAANSRAVASGETCGFVKVLAEKSYGEILGIHIVGCAATEIAGEAEALISGEFTVNEVAENIIHAHPSYSEALMEACKDALGVCAHLPARKKKT